MIVERNAGVPLSFVVERNGRHETLTVTPDDVNGTGRIGVYPENQTAFRDLGIGESIWAGIEHTYALAAANLRAVGQMIVGTRSTEQLSGPVGIAVMSRSVLERGVSGFVEFAALISIALGLINLFPIPPLDGGHLLYNGLEALFPAPAECADSADRHDCGANARYRIDGMGDDEGHHWPDLMIQRAKPMPGANRIGARGRMRHVVWLAAAILALWMGAATAQERMIESVLVEGNERIEADTVRSYLSVGPGDEFDADAVNESLKNLFGSGLFADVAIQREGNALIVRVVENPIINRVVFEGNDAIQDDELAAEVQLQPRVVYTRPRVQEDLQRLTEIYRRSGRFAASIEPKVVQLPQNRIDLVFEVNEGPVTEVRRINFIGNTHFSDSALRDVIQTVEDAWYRFATSDDTYDPDRLTFDRELLRRFYLANGYVDFRVISAVAELTPDRSDFIVTFSIEEGEPLSGRLPGHREPAARPRAGGFVPCRRHRSGRLVRRGAGRRRAGRAHRSHRRPRVRLRRCPAPRRS